MKHLNIAMILAVLPFTCVGVHGQGYPDGRPAAILRMEAKDQGVVLKHGDGPGQCDMLGAREALIFEEKGVYHLFYDGAGPKGWLACLATSKDLKTWEKKGPILDFGKPGESDSAAACAPWVYFDGKEWHMFYLGTPHASPPPDRIPSFPYLTLKAMSKSLAGPWIKKSVVPFGTKPGTYYAQTASPGHIVKQGDEYLMFFSASMQRTLGIARTKDLNSPWAIDPQPIVSPEEQIENSSLYFEPSSKTWFLFTNHIGLEGEEYTDAVWVYWSKDLNAWDAKHKAIVLDGKNCTWSRKCLGMPSVIKVGERLAVFYDAPGGDSKSHMKRDVGLAWLDLPLVPPADKLAVAPSDAAGNQQPFLRDMSTGYLLNCSFLSPRPYCWPRKETVMLSGWDTDKSGGDFDYKPTGEIGVDFAFHSEWFKLVDTNTTASVTLKHQLARQTKGQITLEFRFRMPVVLDGASWQLRDLEQAGPSLLVQGGNLCWGNGNIIVPLEANRDYGVRVIADITGRKADVYVDGELKASALPFVNPIRSVDWFLVTTGDAATGEMFLNPVNIHKGYSVNETFVTCAADKLPSDWNLRGAKVEKFECGTKPDIFSLKIDGEASRKIGTWTGKTVFECKFLLPGAVEGVTIDLGGLHLETLAVYRSNFWYMARLVADPITRTADVYLNGKLLPQKQSFTEAGDSFNFAGKLWVDDLLVYPWIDYPADYVPEPKPVEASHILGVQSCNLWREGTSYAGWDYVRPFAENRKPYLGWYDEGNPEVTDWEIKWLVEHGITFEQHCWYRPNNAVNNPIKDGLLDQGIIKGLFNARYGNLKKFTIMYTDEGACETNPTDWRENVIPYMVEYFFKDSRYLKIDGRPVFSIYQQAHWLRMFGGVEGARQAIQVLRDEVAKAGFPGIYVLMEDRTANQGVLQQMKSMGVDYCYAYTWGTPDAGTQRSMNIAQRDAAGAAGLGMLPSISMGWAREPWGVPDGGWLPPADYKVLLQWTKDEFIPVLPADALGRRVVMLPNWNEFGEGHFLMPSTLAGFGYLDALREVFTDGGTHEDAMPTEHQTSRFNVLFPRD